MGKISLVMKAAYLLLALCATAVYAAAQSDDEILADPQPETAIANKDAEVNSEQVEGGISNRLNQETGSEAGAQVADGSQQGKDMVCVCKRIKKPANVKCNRTVEIEEPPQEKFEVDQVKMMTTCLSGHCEPKSDLNSPEFFVPPEPIEPMECYDRC